MVLCSARFVQVTAKWVFTMANCPRITGTYKVRSTQRESVLPKIMTKICAAFMFRMTTAVSFLKIQRGLVSTIRSVNSTVSLSSWAAFVCLSSISLQPPMFSWQADGMCLLLCCCGLHAQYGVLPGTRCIIQYSRPVSTSRTIPRQPFGMCSSTEAHW